MGFPKINFISRKKIVDFLNGRFLAEPPFKTNSKLFINIFHHLNHLSIGVSQASLLFHDEEINISYYQYFFEKIRLLAIFLIKVVYC
jgi:hypothetical protein